MVRLPADNQRGYILLLSVLVLGAVGLAITLSLLLTGLDASRTVSVSDRASESKALADACAEEALQQIRSNTAYAGSGNLFFNGGSCSYMVTNTGGNTRQVTASGIMGDIIRRLTINVSAINPLITYSSWQETP